MKKLLRKIIVVTALAGLFAALLHGCAETGAKETTLSFHSFDGGGPEYSVSIGDPEMLSCRQSKQYAKANHEELNGAGYDVILTFAGLKEGKTSVTVTCTMRGTEEDRFVYDAEVDKELKVTLEKREDISIEKTT